MTTPPVTMIRSATGRARRLRRTVGLAPNAETSQPSQNTAHTAKIAGSMTRE